jgi:long-chain acyl-CoA synthetase
LFCGGVLVPLDLKRQPDELWQLLRHSGASVLFAEYKMIWRELSVAAGRAAAIELRTVLVTEAPPNADLPGAMRWEDAKADAQPAFTPRARQDTACIVYTSGTGGAAKGCVMTHENYLEQCIALTSLYPFAPGMRYLSILPTNHAVDFMVGFSAHLSAALPWCICARSARNLFVKRSRNTRLLTLAWFPYC